MTDAADRRVVPISKVRSWARQRGIEVGNRGHLSQSLIDQFNRAHRQVRAVNANPMTTRPEQIDLAAGRAA